MFQGAFLTLFNQAGDSAVSIDLDRDTFTSCPLTDPDIGFRRVIADQ
jgi:hypothetical protein